MDMISAREAKALTASSRSNREHAEPDTLSENAMSWALHNAEGRTHTRISLFAKYGRTSLSVKFAPGTKDGKGSGNSFYSDLAANSSTAIADAICDIIYSRTQSLISPLQTARLLNTYNARLTKFIRDLERLGYDVRTGEDEYGSSNLDDSTIIVSWE
ncbi:hypothetical protein [Thermophilibacter immobilis]|nr:hypothetical protein [Thermophilibacter immobilis]